MIRLADYDTRAPESLDRDQAEDQTKDWAKELAELQTKLIATSTHSVLVIFQGMDASGKDGAVRNVFRYCTPNNLSVYSFKKPTEEEFAHDFLWRVHKQCPAKGDIKIFNRSHYEDVLIQRVHGWITPKQVDQRFEAINAFEQLLERDANTLIFKFYLHLSYDQQAEELQERIDEREKNYKHNPGDWEERRHWDRYMECYEDALNRSVVPWTIVPVDQRWYRDYVVSKTLVERISALNLEYPPIRED